MIEQKASVGAIVAKLKELATSTFARIFPCSFTPPPLTIRHLLYIIDTIVIFRKRWGKLCGDADSEIESLLGRVELVERVWQRL
jgi:hypothetical protein